MLLKLEIENFYSVKERQVLDFRVPLTTPESERFEPMHGTQIRVPKVLAFFGPNASGKTTVLRAVSFMRDFVENSFEKYGPKVRIDVQPFAKEDAQSGVTRLAMEFTSNFKEGLFRYELEVQHREDQSNFVSWEAVRVAQPGSRWEMLFERSASGEESHIRAGKEFQLSPKDPRREIRQNVSLISSLVQFAHEPAQNVFEAIKYGFVSNVRVGRFAFPENYVTSYLNERPNALKELNRLIRTIDVGIEKVELRDRGDEKEAVFYHSGLDGVRTLGYESQGTRNFFRLFPNLIYSLGAGATAVLDEIDSDLHPALTQEILRWYWSGEENQYGAQLLVSCQNPSILSDLEKEEVFFVEKSEIGESKITALAEFKGVRRDSNLYTKYRSGAFGAVPTFG